MQSQAMNNLRNMACDSSIPFTSHNICYVRFMMDIEFVNFIHL